MLTDEVEQKITYSTMSVGQAEAFNRAYDRALADVLSRLGETYSAQIGGESVSGSGSTFASRSPNDTDLVLGRFPECGESEVGAAVAAARSAYAVWAGTSWQDRVETLRATAANFRQRKYEISAWLTLEAGKARLEAMGEVEEAADLIDTYCDQMVEHNGYVITLKQLSPTEVNRSVLRPYGVWGVIAPFNFPVALVTGMMAGALVAGNTAVYKPSPDTPLSGMLVYQCFADTPLPAGAVNMVTGSSDDTGKFITAHPDVDGIAFIGSVAVGTQIYHEFSRERPRPVVAEMGGKNPIIVTAHADLDKAVEGSVRAAFGYSGQKCSAASRCYVDAQVADDFMARLVQRTRELVVGDPTGPDVFSGPVINEDAFERFQRVCATARTEGNILTGGTIMNDGDLARGYYCALTVCEMPPEHQYFREELFVPFLSVARVQSFEEAIGLANDSEFGLTAGIFTEDPAERDAFLERMEAGVLYVNRRAGATTGAWPGVQSFGGWKASGSTGKSALGPYYVQQFLREQSQTVVTD